MNFELIKSVVDALQSRDISDEVHFEGIYCFIHSNTARGASNVCETMKSIGIRVRKIQRSNFKPGFYSIFEVHNGRLR
jgi:hypothetical protein